MVSPNIIPISIPHVNATRIANKSVDMVISITTIFPANCNKTRLMTRNNCFEDLDNLVWRNGKLSVGKEKVSCIDLEIIGFGTFSGKKWLGGHGKMV